jgi:hypothetical protein
LQQAAEDVIAAAVGSERNPRPLDAFDPPARRATDWLDAPAETWQKTDLVEEKSDMIHAVYERIVIEGRASSACA